MNYNTNDACAFIDPLLDFPPELNGLKFTGDRLVKGGDRQSLQLVKYPYRLIAEDEGRQAVVDQWMGWWLRTEYAIDPTTPDPHWNSPTRTSTVWTNAGEAADCMNGRPFVYCINCGIILEHPSGQLSIGTKHIAKHYLTRFCQGTRAAVHAPPQTPFTPRIRTTPSSSTPSYSTEAFEHELVCVVIDSNWSFRSVERPSFKRFLDFLRPGTVITTRYKFDQMFHQQYNESRATLLNDIGPHTKMSIALDAWSAANHLSFLAVKGYYINTKWKLRERLLDFVPMRGRHTGESMATDVVKVLSDTNTTSRLLAVTCDNASNNKTMATSMEIQISNNNVDWNSNENIVPCLAHIINLVVQDIIQHLKLEASDELDNTGILQRRHISDVQSSVSVPNSLRKVRTVL
jgi:ribosomal protein S27E